MYGHLNFRDLNKLIQENMVMNIDIKLIRNQFTCEVCDKGKIHQLPYTNKLDLLHCDICGLLNVESIGIQDIFRRLLTTTPDIRKLLHLRNV